MKKEKKENRGNIQQHNNEKMNKNNF